MLSYVQNWKTIGTTAASDKSVSDRYKSKQSVQFRREETFESLPDSLEYTPSKPIFGSSTPLR
jgi:hypothetical protein